jgi:hypothetical protein
VWAVKGQTRGQLFKRGLVRNFVPTLRYRRYSRLFFSYLGITKPFQNYPQIVYVVYPGSNPKNLFEIRNFWMRCNSLNLQLHFYVLCKTNKDLLHCALAFTTLGCRIAIVGLAPCSGSFLDKRNPNFGLGPN